MGMGAAILPAIILAGFSAWVALAVLSGWLGAALMGMFAIVGPIFVAFALVSPAPNLANFVALLGPANLLAYPFCYWFLRRRLGG